ncbi:MAG TPA: glucose-6-phosphate dehydrogenase [Thermomicrobiales bacterium]|jgi:glucose-6-phosphate 1-dehydrogenase
MIDRVVIFGATGDLTARLLMPALAELTQERELPDGLQVLGVGRLAWSADDFRRRMEQALSEHAPHVAVPAREDLIARLDYRRADVTAAAEMDAVLGSTERPLLAYLALPPSLFEPTVSALAAARLPPGSTIAIEKPFGDGVASARHLNDVLRTELPGTTVFRVDHFLSNQLINRIATMRFANRIFEPIWNNQHVERVEIAWDETLTLEGRATYYDGAGALRDMLQNHLLQVLCLVAMEPPSRFDEQSVRDARVAVLRAIPSPTPERVRRHSVRGRYAAGTIGDRNVPAYVDEPGIDPHRQTETFAQVTLEVENWRWKGTQFTIRSGKALAQDRAEVAVHFRPVPGLLFEGQGVTGNVLRIGLLEPSVRLSVNNLGSEHRLAERTLALDTAPPTRPAYANLLLAMLHGRQMVAIRDDETEEMWRIVEPVLAAWAADDVPLLDYPAGSDGPAAARIGDA